MQSLDLDAFLDRHPGLSRGPVVDGGWMIVGEFRFHACYQDRDAIEDSYQLEWFIPASFPDEIPLVCEIGSRIPREQDWHVDDERGALCLGSPLRLRQLLSLEPTLQGFSDQCLVPVLYGNSYRERHGRYPWGELKHGVAGLMEDYVDLFNVPGPREVLLALKALAATGMKAKKLECPCGCGKRLGRCEYRLQLKPLSRIATRQAFRNELIALRAHQREESQ